MKIIPNAATLIACIALSACNSSKEPGSPPGGLMANAILPAEENMAMPGESVPANRPLPTDAWIGKWVGVEGLALDIQVGKQPGHYMLRINLLDGAEEHEGTADGDVIRFTREGKQETIRHVSGADTGLKWLDGKKDCLVIQPGEGFCRD